MSTLKNRHERLAPKASPPSLRSRTSLTPTKDNSQQIKRIKQIWGIIAMSGSPLTLTRVLTTIPSLPLRAGFALICLITIIRCEYSLASPTLTITGITGSSATISITYTTTADSATASLTTASWQYSRGGET